MGIPFRPIARVAPLALALLPLAPLPSPLAAQATPELGGFVVTAGRDTVYLERYAVNEDVVGGEILRVGEDVTVYAIGPGGDLQISRRPAPPADRDFFRPVEMNAGGFGRYPILVDGSIGMLEHLVRLVQREGRQSRRIATVVVTGRELEQEFATVTLPQPGYAEVSLPGRRLRFVLELDASGRVVRGAETTRGWTFHRVPDEWLRD
jgi:hypothetical protein